MSVYFENKHKKARTFVRGYFSTYQSPNIVIMPSTTTINPPPLKKIKDKNCNNVLTENQNDCTGTENYHSQNNEGENLYNVKLGNTPNINNFKQSITLENKIKYNDQTNLSIQNIKENFTNDCNEQDYISDNIKENTKDEMKINVLNKDDSEKNILKDVIKPTDSDLTNEIKVDTVAKVDKYSNSKKEIKPYKRINITIKVNYKKLHKEVNKDIDCDGIMSPPNFQSPDLSFLDDFDVDEVVESLYSCKNNVENDTLRNKKLMDSNHATNDTSEVNKPEVFPTYVKIEKNLQDYNKVPQISDKMNNLNKHKPCSRENGQQSQQVANSHSMSHLHINDKELGDIDQNKKMDEIIQHSKMKNAKIVTEVDSQAEKDHEAISKKGTEVENYNNQNTINVSEPVINTLNILEHVNNKQKIRNYNFVTKSDTILAQQLETCIYNKLNIDCTVTAVIHYGKFSKLFKCEDRSRKYYTVKVLENRVYNKNVNEEELLNKLKRDIPEEKLSCVFLLHSFGLNGHRCLMTYYYNTNLEQYLQDNKTPLDVHKICTLAKQLMEAVFILRINNIVHNDIKPTHILLNTNVDSLKLCGFDEAYYYPGLHRGSTTGGTVHYFSPEKILEYSNGYTVDIWSSALVMYKMATNTNLFLGKTSNDVLFEQMCLFGNFTEDMINGSPLKTDHFNGLNFIRNCTNDMVERNIITLRSWDHVETLILSMQSTLKNGIENQECSYLFKVQLLKNLLKKMFILDPKKRIPIEYVLSNDFFRLTM